ncbi:hypothetical protein Pla108_26820 [Botrimarina colliarenosi]|uniref:DUF1580 domain-containing protein n=1 Tax=Botrimarina colliarenosi TaxID=2528001 RepID=A0A5C6ABX7_9BACT|nr:DUF1580 domain-containing protein [Botrimarina colliarenosi]TWT96906.1 hypothetical protein Pla108_26820 [Botrimarina colliarenosi]
MPLPDETPVALTDAPFHLPRRRGKKVHYATVYRWATKGTRGRVLESQLVGGVRYTTLGALRRYCNAAESAPPLPPRRCGVTSLPTTPELRAIEQALSDAGL